MVRRPLRKTAVLDALACGDSTLYEKIAKGLVPKPVKLDPNGRISIWWSRTRSRKFRRPRPNAGTRWRRWSRERGPAVATLAP